VAIKIINVIVFHTSLIISILHHNSTNIPQFSSLRCHRHHHRIVRDAQKVTLNNQKLAGLFSLKEASIVQSAYRLHDRGTAVTLPAGARKLSLLQSAQTGSYFPRIKRPGRESNQSPSRRAEVSNVWSFTSITAYAHKACTQTNLPLRLPRFPDRMSHGGLVCYSRSQRKTKRHEAGQMALYDS
jgi:hypothetical protein